MAEKNVKFYKTKDGTIVVCKDEVARQQIEQLQGIWEAIEELPDGQAVSAQVAIHTTEIAALQNGKANINGSYDSMTVGMAKNVEATSEISGTSLYRPTAGNADVADGVARVLKIGGNAIPWNQLYDSAVPTAVNNHKYFCREYNGGVKRSEIVLAANLANWFTDGSVNRNVIDLTIMFGAGNEPATPEAFEAWLQANVGLQPYYAYNAGELLSAKLLGMKTVGFNQWDGALESGYWDAEDGSAVASPNWKRSSNPIKVLPDTDYFIYTSHNYQGFGCLLFYDGQMNYLGYLATAQSILKIIKTPANCCFVHFYANNSFGFDTFCINLHYTNGRDGEYEPYVEHQYNFDVTKVYGKLNGDGELMQIFPDGLKSAGSVRDELTINGGVAKAIKRIGSVNAGGMTWGFLQVDAHSRFGLSEASTLVKHSGGAVCAKYITSATHSTVTFMSDKLLVTTGETQETSRLWIWDDDYTDAATFKTAMNGVMLYYELAEYAEYTDLVYRDNGVDTPIDALNIQVSNYGTEEQIVESPTNGVPNSCAATLDILYGANAADFMDAANNGAFVSKASLDALCNTLGSALGGTLTSTWNSAEGHYDFTFTPATRQIENPENNE